MQADLIDDGDTGPTGPTGSTMTGITGPTGNSGPTGSSTGATGPTNLRRSKRPAKLIEQLLELWGITAPTPDDIWRANRDIMAMWAHIDACGVFEVIMYVEQLVDLAVQNGWQGSADNQTIATDDCSGAAEQQQQPR